MTQADDRSEDMGKICRAWTGTIPIWAGLLVAMVAVVPAAGQQVGGEVPVWQSPDGPMDLHLRVTR